MTSDIDAVAQVLDWTADASGWSAEYLARCLAEAGWEPRWSGQPVPATWERHGLVAALHDEEGGAGLEVVFASWDPDLDSLHEDAERFHALAGPRAVELCAAFAGRADEGWRPGAAVLPDWDELGEGEGNWHKDGLNVVVGVLQHDKETPVQVVLRAYRGTGG